MGSALLATNDWDENFTVINIERVSFENCRAGFGGAIFLTGNTKFYLKDVKFLRNKAVITAELASSGVAGCLVQDCSDPKCDMKFEQVEFIDNEAELYSPTVFSKTYLDLSDGVLFRNNKDNLGFSTKHASYPITPVLLKNLSSREHISNETLVSLLLKEVKNSNDLNNSDNTEIHIASGVRLNLTIALTDAHGQLLKFDNLSTANIVYKQTADSGVDSTKGKTTVENSYARCEKGIFFFQNLKINIMPNTTANFSVDISFFENSFGIERFNQGQEDVDSKLSLSLYLKVLVRPCLRGELFKEDLSCMRCDQKTYSLEDPMGFNASFQRCYPCFDGAECLGGEHNIKYIILYVFEHWLDVGKVNNEGYTFNCKI